MKTYFNPDMTVEEAIKWFKNDPFYHKDNVPMNIAIKALEQMNALDKIVAEIESMDFDFGDYYDHTNEIIEMVCKVIDKYRIK